MATAQLVETTITNVTLTITDTEAMALAVVLAHVGGTMDGPRGLTANVADALRAVNVHYEDAPGTHYTEGTIYFPMESL